jgi:hypothetical protein
MIGLGFQERMFWKNFQKDIILKNAIQSSKFGFVAWAMLENAKKSWKTPKELESKKDLCCDDKIDFKQATRGE